MSGPLTGEVYASTCAWPNVGYVMQGGLPVKNVYATHDIQLVDAANSPKAFCYLTGVTGAWSSTRVGGSQQPYARIYVGGGKEIRIAVSPDDNGVPADRVGAYASCVLKK